MESVLGCEGDEGKCWGRCVEVQGEVRGSGGKSG